VICERCCKSYEIYCEITKFESRKSLDHIDILRCFNLRQAFFDTTKARYHSPGWCETRSAYVHETSFNICIYVCMCVYVYMCVACIWCMYIPHDDYYTSHWLWSFLQLIGLSKRYGIMIITEDVLISNSLNNSYKLQISVCLASLDIRIWFIHRVHRRVTRFFVHLKEKE